MATLYNHTHFTFNTTGEMGSHMKPFQLFLDENGNIINRNSVEYGIYNKIIIIDFKKVLMLKKHFIGLGDIIDWITTITKIKNLIIYLTKGNCGCEQRRIKFNKLFKFYWFSIKFREIYSDDLYVIPRQKTFLKNLAIKEKIIVPNNSQQQLPIQPININQTNKKPIKRSCGCASKKLDKSKQ